MVKFELKLRKRNHTLEELLDDLRRVAKKLETEFITQVLYSSEGGIHSYSTYIRRFGSWNRALQEAGLAISSRQGISDEELFENLASVWTLLGRQPARTELTKENHSKFSPSTYVKRFGTWNDALIAFVKYIDKPGKEEVAQVGTNTEDGRYKNPPPPKTPKKGELDGKRKTSRDVSLRLRFKILLRDGFTCKKCGRSPLNKSGVELHVDHIIPWSKGGETMASNLETKCDKCNLGKGNAFSS